MQRFWNRFAIGTNALEWLLTVPNLQIEYDLSAGQYNNQSILVGVRYNWNTWHQQPAYYVFNVLDVRGEWRFHFPKDKPFRVFNWEIPNKRPHLAYYLGAYGNWNQFSMKPGPNGYQGWQAGIGAVIGFERNLYEYKSKGSAVDLDLGLAAGVSFSSADRFRMAASQESYTVTGHRYMLLPMLAEVRATFKWRPVSVKDKYVKEDPQIGKYRNALEDIKNNFKQSTNKAQFDEMLIDSLLRARGITTSALDSAARAEKRYQEYLKYLKDNMDEYRSNFKKFLSSNEEDLKRDFVYADTTSSGKVRIRVREDHDINSKYLKKLIGAIHSETQKAHRKFETELGKDRAILTKAREAESQKAAEEEYNRMIKQAKDEKAKKKDKEQRDADMHAD